MKINMLQLTSVKYVSRNGTLTLQRDCKYPYKWVLKNIKTGEIMDIDIYRYDIAERNNLIL